MPPVGSWVLVEWADAVGVGTDWERLARLESARLGRGLSVGRLSAVTAEWVVIVPHLMEFDGRWDGCGDMTIPRAGIVRVVTLKAPGWAKVEP